MKLLNALIASGTLLICQLQSSDVSGASARPHDSEPVIYAARRRNEQDMMNFKNRMEDIVSRLDKRDSFEILRMRRQIRSDRENAEFVPNLNEGVMVEHTVMGEITLQSDPMYRGTFSTIFKIIGHPEFLIKYKVQCGDYHEIHPSLREAWYMTEANTRGIAPAIRAVSPPQLICANQTGKCNFAMSTDNFENCVARDGVVRYTIMQNLGGNTFGALRSWGAVSNDGAIRFQVASQLGVSLIQALHILHNDLNIVHGDINEGSVMLYPTHEKRNLNRVALINFGRAFRLHRHLPEVPITRPGYWRSYMNTKWQIAGYAWAARDDLYKAVHTIAQCMNPPAYQILETEIEKKGYEKLLEWKDTSNWFVTDIYDPVAALNTTTVSATNQMLIRRSLDRIMHLVKSMPINGPLPYDGIQREFVLCSELSKPQRNSTPTTVTTS